MESGKTEGRKGRSRFLQVTLVLVLLVVVSAFFFMRRDERTSVAPQKVVTASAAVSTESESPVTAEPAIDTPADPVELDSLDLKPQMVGGDKMLYTYIAENNLFPEQAKSEVHGGMVVVAFIVDEMGNAVDVQATQEKPNGLGFGEAGVRAVRAMKFTPGMKDNQPVPVRMKKNIQFRL